MNRIICMEWILSTHLIAIHLEPVLKVHLEPVLNPFIEYIYNVQPHCFHKTCVFLELVCSTSPKWSYYYNAVGYHSNVVLVSAAVMTHLFIWFEKDLKPRAVSPDGSGPHLCVRQTHHVSSLEHTVQVGVCSTALSLLALPTRPLQLNLLTTLNGATLPAPPP